ncbi:MAG: winged helix-turn-helix domain-containing protein, partial [Methanobacteriaceae archaeon]|nr:winged helix-turn-helix domain-containing protein [Methanobacteriaceae archaeon]
LKTISKKEEYKLSEITDEVANNTDLTEKELSITTPNGETLFSSKLGTANMYLKKINCIESTRFLYYKINENGLKLLEDKPDGITEEDLLEFPEFRDYKKVFKPPEEDLDAKSIFEENLKKQLSEFKQFKENNDKISSDEEDNEELDFKKESKKCGCKGPKHKGHGKHKGKCGCKGPKKCHKHAKVFSPAKEIKKYAKLLEKGYLTKEEFDAKKKELLAIKYTDLLKL